MKQLSLRLLAYSGTEQTIISRIVHFAGRKINHVITTPQRLIGKWRLYMNYCPECNSCAPKIHHCEVCNANTKAYFSWNDDIKKAWWKKYAEKHHIAA